MKYLYYFLGFILFTVGMILNDVGKADFLKGLGYGLCGVGGMFIYIGVVS